MAVVYLHRRKDTNEVFYVGIGQTEKRAYDIKNRKNKHWKGIVEKYGYTVEIFLTDLSWDQACEKEKELIAEIGRKDLKLGPLVNMTDGGEGQNNPSEETRRKLQYKKTEQHKELLRSYRIGVKQSKETVEKRLATGFHKTEDYKQKQREAHLGKPRSEETKQKLRKPKPPRTKEHSDRISQAKKGKPSHMRGVKKSHVWEFEKEIKDLRNQGWSLEKLRKHYKCGERTLLKILSN
jgi:hypothetical protein